MSRQKLGGPCSQWTPGNNVLDEAVFEGDMSRATLANFGHGLGFGTTPFILFYFIYLFLAALGLCCCAQVSSSCGEQELLFVAVRGLLIAVASLVAEHRL